jgi:phosphatidylglycerophosphatase C
MRTKVDPTPASTEPAPQNTPVTLFDLDGVLTRRDTMATLVRHRLRGQPPRVALVLPLALLARLLRPAGNGRPAVNRAIVRLALRGLTRADYDNLARATARELAAEPDNAPSTALQQLRVAAAAGQVVVVTASEALLARTYLDEIGVPQVDLLASQLQGREGRPRLVPHNVGVAKVDALYRAGIDLADAHLYTDSASDLPLARRTATTTLVNPTRRLRRSFSRRVTNLQTAHW